MAIPRNLIYVCVLYRWLDFVGCIEEYNRSCTSSQTIYTLQLSSLLGKRGKSTLRQSDPFVDIAVGYTSFACLCPISTLLGFSSFFFFKILYRGRTIPFSWHARMIYAASCTPRCGAHPGIYLNNEKKKSLIVFWLTIFLSYPYIIQHLHYLMTILELYSV